MVLVPKIITCMIAKYLLLNDISINSILSNHIYWHTTVETDTSSLGHAKKDPTASPTLNKHASSIGTGRGALSSSEISMHTFTWSMGNGQL